MPQGIAVHLGAAPEHLYHLGQLFRVYPSLGNSEDADNYIVVASTNRTVDHGQGETTIFATDSTGDTHNMLDHGAEVLDRDRRIVGAVNVRAALANLRNGYYEVSQEELPPLRAKAHQEALEFAQNRLAMRNAGARDYADNNWGLFAAALLEKDPSRPPLTQTRNSVNWADLDAEEEARAHDPAWDPFF